MLARDQVARWSPPVMVAWLCALVVHQVAYVTADLVGASGAATGDHGHLAMQWAMLLPAAVVAGVVWTLRQAAESGYRLPLSVGSFAALVGSVFAVQEGLEALLAGNTLAAAFTSAPVLLGVVIAPVVAVLCHRALSEVVEFVARRSTCVATRRPVVAWPAQARRVPASLAIRCGAPRGPPSGR